MLATRTASILVHVATGFTGTLVCEALGASGLAFAISGRSGARLEALARRFEEAPATFVIDLALGDTVRTAIDGRRIVLACAGPFVEIVEIGEPMLAACTRAGIAHADTTGEQRFVANAASRYQATCEASGACMVPGMAYEIAPADWAAHVAAEETGGAPDTIDILDASL